MIYREIQRTGKNERGEITQGSGEIKISFNGVEAEDVKVRVRQMLRELEQIGYTIKTDRTPQMLRKILRDMAQD